MRAQVRLGVGGLAAMMTEADEEFDKVCRATWEEMEAAEMPVRRLEVANGVEKGALEEKNVPKLLLSLS